MLINNLKACKLRVLRPLATVVVINRDVKRVFFIKVDSFNEIGVFIGGSKSETIAK